jgi:hypothetical protein
MPYHRGENAGGNPVAASEIVTYTGGRRRPQTPHVEKHFTTSEAIRDIVIGISASSQM